jgi:hypothetical protein
VAGCDPLIDLIQFTAEAQRTQREVFFALSLRRRQGKTAQPCGLKIQFILKIINLATNVANKTVKGYGLSSA